jgi:hypothetical protein
MNYYQNYNPTYNPYFNQPRVQSVPQQIPMEQQINQPQAQPYVQQPIKPIGLLGKFVDNIDVVKVMDISLDGNINYFHQMPTIDNHLLDLLNILILIV